MGLNIEGNESLFWGGSLVAAMFHLNRDDTERSFYQILSQEQNKKKKEKKGKKKRRQNGRNPKDR